MVTNTTTTTTKQHHHPQQQQQHSYTLVTINIIIIIITIIIIHNLQIWLVKKTPSVAYKTHANAAWNNPSCGPQEKTRTAWQAAPE